ncbi:hypothetical protein AVEN_38227-1 [Araneus ventricosus]|uniref:Uncharacterized protein n=1 Tax=Araneus ventricosus TaxID=182803 RepID=A0A4Y2RIP5_ARAVE|nr:hypothetical protein AVEN_38227-1 [Araneus ventricosus]
MIIIQQANYKIESENNNRSHSIEGHDVTFALSRQPMELPAAFRRSVAGASSSQGTYSVDETGVTTVQNPRKTTAMNGTKQVGAVTTVERGSLVTMSLALSANAIQFLLFSPRKIFKRHFLSNVPQGSSDSSNKSRWMTEQDFHSFMRQFIKHARLTRETCPTYSGQSSVSFQLTNIGRGQSQRSDSFVFPNYILLKNEIQIMILMITHQNNLGN